MGWRSMTSMPYPASARPDGCGCDHGPTGIHRDWQPERPLLEIDPGQVALPTPMGEEEFFEFLRRDGG